jgi:parallel beta-helix repeat protein
VKRGALVAALATGITAFAAGPAMAATFKVDDDHAQCPDAPFTSIQAAVNAAGQNDTVAVCPGTYTEQVRITSHAKDGLKLVATRPLQATIQAPAVMTQPNSIVLIDDVNRVTMFGFVVRGPFSPLSPGSCALPLVGSDPSVFDTHRGVYVRSGSGHVVTGNHITLIRNTDPALLGCQDGISVQVGRMAEGASATAVVSGNVIDEYQKGGVVVDNDGSYGAVAFNHIEAAQTVQPSIAPNGVQVSRGAAADVSHNDISENHFGGDPNAGSGAGVLLFQTTAGDVDVDNNDVSANDDGISLSDADGASIDNNESHDNVLFDGIFVDEDSTGNSLKNNEALNNAALDCEDESTGSGTAGTANSWKNDTGVTQDPPGICRPPRGNGGNGHGSGNHGHGKHRGWRGVH